MFAIGQYELQRVLTIWVCLCFLSNKWAKHRRDKYKSDILTKATSNLELSSSTVRDQLRRLAVSNQIGQSNPKSNDKLGRQIWSDLKSGIWIPIKLRWQFSIIIEQFLDYIWICFNRFRHDELDSDDEFGSKISIKSCFDNDLVRNFSPSWFNRGCLDREHWFGHWMDFCALPIELWLFQITKLLFAINYQ